MKATLTVLLVTIASWQATAQKTYKATAARIGFYSHTPIEDIEAKSDKASSVIDPSKNQLAFVVTNTSFVFPNSLMQEHFNDKYMESDKYPKSSFSGKINEPIDWNVDGEYKATVTGKLKIHGEETDRTIPATISIKEGKVSAKSEFMVKTADHKIEIPKLVWEKIAEELKVNVSAEYVLQ
jgi:polyisoprenoid-binding protein YceI